MHEEAETIKQNLKSFNIIQNNIFYVTNNQNQKEV